MCLLNVQNSQALRLVVFVFKRFFCSAAKIINACKKQFSLKHTVFYPARFYGVI